MSLIELLVVMSIVAMLLRLGIYLVHDLIAMNEERKAIEKAKLVLEATEVYWHTRMAVPTIADLIAVGLLDGVLADYNNINIAVDTGPGGDPCLWRTVRLKVEVTDPDFQGFLGSRIDYNPASHTYTLWRHVKLPQSRTDYFPKAMGDCNFPWMP